MLQQHSRLQSRPWKVVADVHTRLEVTRARPEPCAAVVRDDLLLCSCWYAALIMLPRSLLRLKGYGAGHLESGSIGSLAKGIQARPLLWWLLRLMLLPLLLRHADQGRLQNSASNFVGQSVSRPGYNHVGATNPKYRRFSWGISLGLLLLINGKKRVMERKCSEWFSLSFSSSSYYLLLLLLLSVMLLFFSCYCMLSLKRKVKKMRERESGFLSGVLNLM